MKRILLSLTLLLGIAYGQTVITQPDTIRGSFLDYRSDSAMFTVLTPASKGAVVFIDCEFSGASPAFVSTGTKKQYAGQDWPEIHIINCKASGLDNGTGEGEILPAGSTRPWLLEAGGLNTVGVINPTIEFNTLYNMGGVRWKKTAGLPTGRFVGNLIYDLNQAVSDGEGGWWTQNEAAARMKARLNATIEEINLDSGDWQQNPELSAYHPQIINDEWTKEQAISKLSLDKKLGTIANSYTRQGFVIGADFTQPAHDILITLNAFYNRPPAYSTDVISIRCDVDTNTIILDENGYCIASGLTVENNMVVGNYHLYWDRSVQQAGCAYILDWDKTGATKGGVLFRGNYAISCSNTSFQHASYGTAYYYNNTVVSDGYYKGTRVGWNGRGFGIYQSRTNQAAEVLPDYRNNRSAYKNTRFGGLLDFATKKQGGGHYPDTIYNKQAPYQNQHLGDPTSDMEQQYLLEYQAFRDSAILTYSRPVSDSIITPIDTLEIEIGVNVDSLVLALRAVEQERDSLVLQNEILSGEMVNYIDRIIVKDTEIQTIQLEKIDLEARIARAIDALIVK